MSSRLRLVVRIPRCLGAHYDFNGMYDECFDGRFVVGLMGDYWMDEVDLGKSMLL